ncbi:MAG TPA: lysylphosphatidylglycerol synthase domain-containing protein [Noviherbaspirillum sp.]
MRRQGQATSAWSRAWPLIKRVLTVGFLGLVLTLLVIQMREVDWNEVSTSLQRYGVPALLLALALAAASHVLYGLFDQIGRAYTGHRLPRLRVAAIAFVSYAFNLNMGALVGGVGFRYRLYSRYGLDGAAITRVMGLSIAANWLGYCVVAGTVFALGVVKLPPGWDVGSTGLRWIGCALLAAALAYLAACGFSTRRAWTVRGHEIALPTLRMALLQMLISSLNWMLIGALVYLLLHREVAYSTVLAVFLISAIAGVITHVPAGLGVIELVFISLLGHALPRSELIAALLAYRAVYYLLPLAVALLVYLRLEAATRKSKPS